MSTSRPILAHDRAMTLARAAILLTAAATAGCLAHGPGAPRYPMQRHGPDRTTVPYEEPLPEDKRALFERINRDRAAHGVPAVQYEPRAARVGDRFCLDSATSGLSGHWDLEGRAPYLRWGLAGGVDFHAENSASFSITRGPFPRPVRDLILEAHDKMMAEVPPDDGHRRTILEPGFTHVGIGLAEAGNELRMTEEFTRVAFEWIETPAGPLRAGQRAAFAGRPLKGWTVGVVEVRFEPPPRPLTVLEVRRRHAYAYPAVIRSLVPALSVPFGYIPSRQGDFNVGSDGSFSVTFPLDAGPGHYFVLCYLRPSRETTGFMGPATAAMVTALP
jgi:uncharacterized protein YkwD